MLNLEFSGVVTVANNLDYDTQMATRIYTLEITAADTCNNIERNQTGVLTINIVNEDDNPPECPSIISFPNATEGVNVTNFFTYPATDADAPPFDARRYSIVPVSTGNVFSVDQDDGIIAIRGDLIDREVMSIYCETVLVTSTMSPLNCSAQVTLIYCVVCMYSIMLMHFAVLCQHC